MLHSFDHPAAAPEGLSVKLTLVCSHREGALRAFALQDVRPAWKAEKDLYDQHKDNYRAQQQQQQQGLRRSSRAATRASSVAAGRGGGVEVSVLEDAKVRVVIMYVVASGCGVVQCILLLPAWPFFALVNHLVPFCHHLHHSCSSSSPWRRRRRTA